MTQEEALEVSNELAVAFMRHARERKATRSIVLDSLVGMIARTLESFDDPEQRASMIAETERALAAEIGGIKRQSEAVRRLLDQALATVPKRGRGGAA